MEPRAKSLGNQLYILIHVASAPAYCIPMSRPFMTAPAFEERSAFLFTFFVSFRPTFPPSIRIPLARVCPLLFSCCRSAWRGVASRVDHCSQIAQWAHRRRLSILRRLPFDARAEHEANMPLTSTVSVLTLRACV